MSNRRALAEVVGTFVLVFGGVGSAVIAGEEIGNLGVAFAFGLSLLVMAYAVGPVSGCHINPAVTLGLLVRGKIDTGEAARYWIAQVVGAIAAAALLLVIVEARKAGYDPGVDGLGANGYGDHSPGGYPWGAALAIEVVLTAFLVFTVLAATDRIANVAFAGSRSASARRSSWGTGRSSSCGCSSSGRSSGPFSAPACTRRCSRARRESNRGSQPSRPTEVGAAER